MSHWIRNLRPLAFCLWLPFLALPSVAEEAAEAWRVGDTLPAFSLEDCHGDLHCLEPATNWLFYSRDRAGDEILDLAVKEHALGQLNSGEAVYMADISGMPGIITKLFALPAMRKRDYPILLDHEGEATARLPHREEQLTILRLQGLRITGIAYAADANEVMFLVTGQRE